LYCLLVLFSAIDFFNLLSQSSYIFVRYSKSVFVFFSPFCDVFFALALGKFIFFYGLFKIDYRFGDILK
jgi:hypothetical protein